MDTSVQKLTPDQYFLDHSINSETLKRFGVSVNLDQSTIKIPVKDIKGKTIFHKYRNLLFNPEDPTSDKYFADSGSKATLFNADRAKDKDSVIICEGEFDVMKLDQEGFNAVTSTAGAMTFKKEWVKFFEGKEVYLCMDNDKAGIEATRKLIALFPEAKVVTLPEGVKDVCDFFKSRR